MSDTASHSDVQGWVFFLPLKKVTIVERMASSGKAGGYDDGGWSPGTVGMEGRRTGHSF